MPIVDVGRVKLSYRDSQGHGRPVLLLHAFPFGARLWAPQFDALGDRYRMIAPDLKGFGDSDTPDDPGSYSVDSYADEVKGLLDVLGVTRVVLCGLSMGGYISLAVLRRHPGIVSALVLADTKADADPPEGIARRTKQQDQVRTEGTARLIDTLTDALLAEVTTANKPDVAARVRALMDQPAAGFVGALDAMKRRPDATDELTRIKVPTLIIVGENDSVTPPEFARKMHEHIGGSRLVVVPEAGHIANLEAPDAFNGALGEFLAELPPD